MHFYYKLSSLPSLITQNIATSLQSQPPPSLTHSQVIFIDVSFKRFLEYLYYFIISPLFNFIFLSVPLAVVLIYQCIITNTDLTQLTQKITIIVTIVVFLSSIYWLTKGDINTHSSVQLDSQSCVSLSFYIYQQCHANAKVRVRKQKSSWIL